MTNRIYVDAEVAFTQRGLEVVELEGALKLDLKDGV